eukprot:TRINITY_DN9748_c0_g2_i1.p1 TRINITY_DN9748_c0_g2~~TRINITY_DN9748_c0_g2_i1.p1  ORF type:complete len:688 (-),score=54.17 TRINITY_DN9748_c0_g2_i1:50-2113(-)
MLVVRALKAVVALPIVAQGWLGEWDGSRGQDLSNETRKDGLLAGPNRWAGVQSLVGTYPDSFVEKGANFGISKENDNKELMTRCTPLQNHGTHFTVQIGVGTPSQIFQVVADTGSSFVIVPSCVCVRTRKCSPYDGCFQGCNKSSTFSMVRVIKQVDCHVSKTSVPMAVVTFGTGMIEAAIAEDVVDVGGVTGKMTNGLMLMVNQALHMRGGFGGILGLGLPGSQSSRGTHNTHNTHNKGPTMKSVNGSRFLLNIRPPHFNVDTRHREKPHTSFKMGKGFLQEAGVDRFSMCFNDGADGVLRLHSPKPHHSLQSIGKRHWGLDFRGISVETDHADKALFCHHKRRTYQDSVCGAIPDSGTTVMTGPKRHIRKLFQSLCDRWERCATAFAKERSAFHGRVERTRKGSRLFEQGSPDVDLAAVFAQKSKKDSEPVFEGENQTEAQVSNASYPPFAFGGLPDAAMRLHHVGPPTYIGHANMSRHAHVLGLPLSTNPHSLPYPGAVYSHVHEIPTRHGTFMKTLHDCHSWMGNDTGLNELPPIYIHVAGRGGRNATALKIPGSGYVLEMKEDQLKYAMSKVNCCGHVPIARHLKRKKVCNPAFGVMDFKTKKNGPIWILGAPLFYQYQVGYDLAKEGASISFSKEPCGTCDTSKGAALLQREGDETRAGPRPPRFVGGHFREPSYDLSLGL